MDQRKKFILYSAAEEEIADCEEGEEGLSLEEVETQLSQMGKFCSITCLGQCGAFAATDCSEGKVVMWLWYPASAWGRRYLLPPITVRKNLINVDVVVGSWNVFAALKTNGEIHAWGYGDTRGIIDDSGNLKSEMQAALTPHGDVKIKDIIATKTGFVVLKTDGSVITFGVTSGGKCINSVGENPDRNKQQVQKFIDEILPLISSINGTAIRAMKNKQGFIVTTEKRAEFKVDLEW